MTAGIESLISEISESYCLGVKEFLLFDVALIRRTSLVAVLVYQNSKLRFKS